MEIFGGIKIILSNFYFSLRYLTTQNIIKMNTIFKSKINNLKNENTIEKLTKNSETLYIISNKKEQLFDEIFTKLDFQTYLKTFVLIIQGHLKVKIHSIHKNILLIGNSGIGKSTLLNKFLKINEAETGIGKGITKDFKSYISSQENEIRLYDSKGFNKDSYEESIKNVKHFIYNQLTKSKDEFIHCIWYCFTGTRYDEYEIEAINSLLSEYEYDYLPIIIVYLQTTNEDLTKELFDKMKEELNDNKNTISFVSVLAENKEIKIGRQQFIAESFGLEELKDITLRKINESGLKSAYYKSIKERIILLYKKNINNKYNIIKNKVFSMIDIIQYHSICFLDCEKYFLEVLKLIFFMTIKNII